MKLSIYFTHRAQEKLTDEQKTRLFQRILTQRATAQQGLKRSILTKRLSYSLIASLLFFVFFGTYFWDSLDIVDYRAFFTQKLPSINITQADQVGSILSINGEYLIEKEGKTFQNSVLFDGDHITLKSNTKITFNLNNEDTKIQIEGPAQFIITKKVTGFYLHLIDGDYLKIESQKIQNTLEIETEDFNISAEKHQKVDFEFKKQDQETQIKNKGESLLVSTKTNTNEQTSPTELPTAQMLTLQDNDISTIENIENFSQALMAKNNLTYTRPLKQPIETDQKEANKQALIEEI